MLGRGGTCSQECLDAIPSPAQPHPCPRTGAPCACWAGTVSVTHCLLLDVLWWPSNNLCVPNCEPHTAAQGLIPASKHLLPPSTGRVVSLPPPKCPHGHICSSFCACWTFSPCQELRSASSHLLNDSRKCCQCQEILIPVQERVCRAWFYLLLKHNAVQALVSPCHQQ